MCWSRIFFNPNVHKIVPKTWNSQGILVFDCDRVKNICSLGCSFSQLLLWWTVFANELLLTCKAESWQWRQECCVVIARPRCRGPGRIVGSCLHANTTLYSRHVTRHTSPPCIRSTHRHSNWDLNTSTRRGGYSSLRGKDLKVTSITNPSLSSGSYLDSVTNQFTVGLPSDVYIRLRFQTDLWSSLI